MEIHSGWWHAPPFRGDTCVQTADCGKPCGRAGESPAPGSLAAFAPPSTQGGGWLLTPSLFHPPSSSGIPHTILARQTRSRLCFAQLPPERIIRGPQNSRSREIASKDRYLEWESGNAVAREAGLFYLCRYTLSWPSLSTWPRPPVMFLNFFPVAVYTCGHVGGVKCTWES